MIASLRPQWFSLERRLCSVDLRVPASTALAALAFSAPYQPSVSGGALAAANKIYLTGFPVYTPIVFSKITLTFSTGDAVNNQDFGLYNPAGTLVANIGAQIIAGTAAVTYNVVQGSQTIQPGLYYSAWTSNGTTSRIWFASSWGFFTSNNFGSSAGGALPGSITPPAAAANFNMMAPILT